MKKYIQCLVVGLMILVLSACQWTEEKTTTEEEATTEPKTVYPSDDNCDNARANAQEGWIPVWCDEFDYTGMPDPSKWNLEQKGDGFGNNELQFYTRRIENVWAEDGVLRITARKEYYGGRSYTSAKLMSNGKGDFLYGRFEIRAKIPEGRGTWPAIWMMPIESKYGIWPNSGEIDIMEHVGYDMNRIHGTIHTQNYNHKNGTQKGHSIMVSDVANTFHVYAMEWEPTGIKWFVDGEQYYEFKNDGENNPDGSSGNWPFDHPFYLIMNVAFGGDWGGARGIDPTFTESSMYVDYVRVYQKDYESLDQEPPSQVGHMHIDSDNPNKTTIGWEQATDDVGIQYYEWTLGDRTGKTVTNRLILNDLEPHTTYTLIVKAVDFVGNVSEARTFTFTTGQYPPITTQIAAKDYVAMEGIQLETTSDSGTGQNVAYIDADDYFVYKLYVPKSGTYRLNIRIAAMADQRELEVIQVQAEGEQLLTTLMFDSTGGWQTWETIVGEGTFELEEGSLTIKLKAKTNNFNINWLLFEETA